MMEKKEHEEKILNAVDAANYFLILVNQEAGDLITQLKLQKLIYLAQGISLALYEKPLFKEEIEAWEHGPVVKSLRVMFGGFGAFPISLPGEMDFDIYSLRQKKLIYKSLSVNRY